MIAIWGGTVLLAAFGMLVFSSGIWKALFSLSLFMLGFSFSSVWEPWKQIVLFEGGVLLLLILKTVFRRKRKTKKRDG